MVKLSILMKSHCLRGISRNTSSVRLDPILTIFPAQLYSCYWQLRDVSLGGWRSGVRAREISYLISQRFQNISEYDGIGSLKCVLYEKHLYDNFTLMDILVIYYTFFWCNSTLTINQSYGFESDSKVIMEHYCNDHTIRFYRGWLAGPHFVSEAWVILYLTL